MCTSISHAGCAHKTAASQWGHVHRMRPCAPFCSLLPVLASTGKEDGNSPERPVAGGIYDLLDFNEEDPRCFGPHP